MLNQSSTWKSTREGKQCCTIMLDRKEDEGLQSGTVSPVKGQTDNTVLQYSHMLAVTIIYRCHMGPYKCPSNSVVVKPWQRNTHQCDNGNWSVSAGREEYFHMSVNLFNIITNQRPAGVRWKVSSPRRNANKWSPLRPGYWDLSKCPPPVLFERCWKSLFPSPLAEIQAFRLRAGEIAAQRICCRDLQKLIAHDRSHSSHMWERWGSRRVWIQLLCV